MYNLGLPYHELGNYLIDWDTWVGLLNHPVFFQMPPVLSLMLLYWAKSCFLSNSTCFWAHSIIYANQCLDFSTYIKLIRKGMYILGKSKLKNYRQPWLPPKHQKTRTKPNSTIFSAGICMPERVDVISPVNFSSRSRVPNMDSSAPFRDSHCLFVCGL